MATRQTTWSTEQTLTSAALNNEFNEIFTNITDANIASGANIAISKTALGVYIAPTSWTPSLYKSDGTTALTGTVQTARYLQIGKKVTCILTLTAVGNPAGSTIVFDLPVTARTNTNAIITGSGYAKGTGITAQMGRSGIGGSVTAKGYLELADQTGWPTSANEYAGTFEYEAA
jgi:hypothetical protein